METYKMGETILKGLMVLILILVLALIFQNWLQIPADTLRFLEGALVTPAIAALLTAFRGFIGTENK